MKRLISLLIIISALPLFLAAQSVSIQGKAQERVFEKVQIKVYADQFSHLRKTIAETITDDEGNFSLTFDYLQTDYAWISVELLEGEFYLTPGAGYTFDVFPDTVRKGSVYDQLPLQFNMQAKDDGLNDNLARFNAMYNSFVVNHFNEIYRSRDLTVIHQLRKEVEDTFKGESNDYFNTYVKYSLAQLEWVSKKKSTNTIISEYFFDKPIHYNNIQYTDFFKSVFQEYVVSKFYGKYFGQLVEAVHKGSLEELEQILLQDEKLAVDQKIRELVLMQLVSKFYNDPDFSKKGVIEILSKLSKSSSVQFHREIAGNYIKKLTRLASGTPAPQFELPVSSGKLLSPKDFKGQVVIFDFLKADCKICLMHFDFLQDLSSRMGSKLKIVVLAYGDHPEKITQLLRQRGIDWQVLYVGKRTDVLNDYQVKIFPTYIILNPDATIGLAPASMADENLENEVLWVINASKTQ